MIAVVKVKPVNSPYLEAKIYNKWMDINIWVYGGKRTLTQRLTSILDHKILEKEVEPSLYKMFSK